MTLTWRGGRGRGSDAEWRACRFCQTPFMFSAKFRHRSVGNVRWHVDRMRERGLRDVRFTNQTALSYGTQTDEPDLAAVEELLASFRGHRAARTGV